MKLKPYPKYKPSRIDWLGEVPEHWGVKRIGHTTYVKGRVGWQGLTSDEFIDEGPYCVTGTDFLNGRINWETSYHVDEERYEEDPYIHLQENDLLITKDGTIGKTAIVKQLTGKATLNSGIFLTRPLRGVYFTDFMYWILNSKAFTQFIDLLKTGTTISHLYQNVFVRFKFPLPPLPEQHVITEYLNREVDKIDDLISKKEHLIELLKEKRVALISRAVTKGFNPNVRFKPSGVEWLGDVPENWEVKQIRRVATRIQTGNTPPTAEEQYYEDGTIPWFGPSSFKESICLTEPVKLLNKLALQDGVARLFSVGTIMIVGIGATIGKVSSINSEASCNQQITGVTFKTSAVEPQFLTYQLKQLELTIREIAPSATLAIFDQDKVADLWIVLPPYPEQQAIVEYLDRETGTIDALIGKIQIAIEKLKEYRTALISAAVTGKIDVREEAA